MTRYQQARPRRTLRIHGLWLGLALMLLSAAVTLAAGWWLLSVFLGMAEYIRSSL